LRRERQQSPRTEADARKKLLDFQDHTTSPSATAGVCLREPSRPPHPTARS
jgi:hypothetical protein